MLISIDAAGGAESLAILPAERLDGQGKKNLLAQGFFEFHALARVESDFGLGLVDGDLVGAFAGLDGAVQKIERAGDRDFDRFEAAGTGGFDTTVQLSHQTDVVDGMLAAMVLAYKFGVAQYGKRAKLTEIGAEVNLAGLEAQVVVLPAQLQVLHANHHDAAHAPELPHWAARPPNSPESEARCKRKRQEASRLADEPAKNSYSWREKRLRTGIKDKFAGAVVSNRGGREVKSRSVGESGEVVGESVMEGPGYGRRDYKFSKQKMQPR
jgi:hypothetical protein